MHAIFPFKNTAVLVSLVYYINKFWGSKNAFLTGLGGLIARSLEEQLFRWLRAAELTCDRAALLVAQDPKVYMQSLPPMCFIGT